MKIVKWLLTIILFCVVYLFFYQNHTRMPTIDSQGAYLSLDLYFFGVVQKDPISLNWYLGGAFLLGMLFSKVFALRKK